MTLRKQDPLNMKPDSNMRRVFCLIEAGIHDRSEMSQILGITRDQVYNAIENLKACGLIEVHKHNIPNPGRGRLPTIYKAVGKYVSDNCMSGVSFIFWACKGSQHQG